MKDLNQLGGKMKEKKCVACDKLRDKSEYRKKYYYGRDKKITYETEAITCKYCEQVRQNKARADRKLKTGSRYINPQSPYSV